MEGISFWDRRSPKSAGVTAVGLQTVLLCSSQQRPSNSLCHWLPGEPSHKQDCLLPQPSCHSLSSRLRQPFFLKGFSVLLCPLFSASTLLQTPDPYPIPHDKLSFTLSLSVVLLLGGCLKGGPPGSPLLLPLPVYISQGSNHSGTVAHEADCFQSYWLRQRRKNKWTMLSLKTEQSTVHH